MITEIHWELTNHCNFACAHCYLSNDSRAELSTDQIFNLLEQMHNYGILYLTLSGGEPLLRADFDLIYKKAHSMGFLINIFTNGSLITDKIVNLFLALPPQKVEITVNGITKSTFEKVTLKKESFEATFSGIKKLHNAGIFLGIKTNGMTLNKDEILEIKSYFQSMPNVFFKFDTAIMPRRDHHLGPTKLRMSTKEIIDLYKSQPDMKEQIESECSTTKLKAPASSKMFQCEAAESRFHISAWGDLHPCHTVRNIHTSLLLQTFENAVEQIRSEVRAKEYSENSSCRSCKVFSICNSCPGIAHLEMKDANLQSNYLCNTAKNVATEFSTASQE